MKKKISIVLSIILIAMSINFASANEQRSSFDAEIVVYGATPGGLSAAAAAAREGRKVILIEQMPYLGGLLGSGFNMFTDVPVRETLGGFTLWWYDRTCAHKGSQRMLKISRALADEMLKPYSDKIQILLKHRICSVEKKGNRILSIDIEGSDVDKFGIPIPEAIPGTRKKITGKEFIDASYEGDLMAMADVSYVVGRESTAQYGESLAGVRSVHRFPGVSPYNIEGDPSSGLLPFIDPNPLGKIGDANPSVNGYNFKFFFGGKNGRPMDLPDTTNVNYLPVKKLLERSKKAGYPLIWPHPNDERRQLFTGSIPGIQTNYPEGDWNERSKIWREYVEHARRLTHFSGKKVYLDTGLSPETNGVPPHLYVRAARRLLGEYVLTQKDIQLQTKIPASIGLGFYAIDLHLARMLVLEDGTLATEGELLEMVSPGPWKLPYGFITPKREECTNLLVPVCFSASHIAHGATRLEAQYMILGESAGIAASHALEEGTAVQEINIKKLQKRLRECGQKLEWDGKGYGRYRTNLESKWPQHVIHRWQTHPEEYKKYFPPFNPDLPIMMDDIDAVKTGDWEELSKHGHFMYQGYLDDKNEGKGTKTATFNIVIPKTGYYDIEMAYFPKSDNSKHVPVIVTHADGVDTVYVDQTRRLRNRLFDPIDGRYRFKKNTKAKITVSTEGTEDGSVLVDAFHLLYVKKTK